MELLFSKRLKENRLRLGMTQEKLAEKIGISYQSISKWERGDGLPDLTLLPRIAFCFGITVDELIGSDVQTREEDKQDFFKRFYAIIDSFDGWEERLAMAKEYYGKYPQDFEIIRALEQAIVHCSNDFRKNEDLMLELHEKIMAGCTNEDYRRDSMHWMCIIASDEALEGRIIKSELRWEEVVGIGELCEERFLLQRRYDEYRAERNATDLLVFMHYLGRNGFDYYATENAHLFEEPTRTASWEKQVMRLLDAFDPSGVVPDGWTGCYADAALKAAGALIAAGDLSDGFAMLDTAFAYYERWTAFPDGASLPLGCGDAFGGATITKFGKQDSTSICFPDGKKVWSTYIWLFWQTKREPLWALTQWRWFDAVKDDERYQEALKRAKEMAE